MTENNNMNVENVNKKIENVKYVEENIDEYLDEDDIEYRETGIWKNPYAMAIIIIAIWFSLWLFMNVFMGRWFS
ncbi:hypothetical protein [Picrophilus oshimae]|uniref:hypothetical protein n=1 Tax=Picrophilus oshimae TaxID=46632 RepID=UPI0012932F2A|nr:hypothetical protein [Picrophilus oshimae]